MSDNKKDLAPGLELDALVAEKVMGWHKEMFDKGGPDEFARWVDCKGRWCIRTNWFEPSSNIEDAMRVWETIKGDTILRKNENGRFWCTLWRPNGGAFFGSFEGTTAPHAICIAALKWAGGKDA